MKLFRSLALLFLTLAAVRPAFAQDAQVQQGQLPSAQVQPGQLPSSIPLARKERPYHGLFGSGVGDTSQLLVVSGEVGGGFATNIQADQLVGTGSSPTTSQAAVGRNREFLSFQTGVSYQVQGQKLGFLVAEGSSARRYQELGNDIIASHAAKVGVTYDFSPRTHLEVYQSATFMPLYALTLFGGLFPLPVGEAMPEDQDLGTVRDDHRRYETSGTFLHRLSRRSTFGVTYNFGKSVFPAAVNDQTVSTGTMRYTRTLVRGLDLNLGYGYTVAHYVFGAETPTTKVQNLDLGLGYNRELSFSRRTKLAFNSGTAGYNDQAHTRYRIVGRVALMHEIGRTWTTSVGYYRDVGFVENLRDPTFSDSISVGLSGLVTRRLQLHSAAGGAVGTVGLSTNANRFSGYYGEGGFTIGLTRFMGLDVSYVKYHYHVGAQQVLPIGVFTQLDRQSIRFALQLWSPLINRGRRAQ